MAIFYTDSSSFNDLKVSGSTIMSASTGIVLQLKSSGSTIFSISGSSGEIFNISDVGTSNSLFSVASSSITIFNIDSTKTISVSGSLIVTGSITGSLLGTASYATTASYAMNGGGGSTFPYNGSAIITGSLLISGSGLTVTGSLNVTQGITGSLQGTASWATNAVTASEVLVTDTATGVGPYYITFVDGTTADRAIRVDSNGLSFNATTNTLTTTASFATTASYALISAGGSGGISQGKVVAIATGYSNLF